MGKLAGTFTKVKVASQSSKMIFIIISEFKFLDVINYLSPGTSYDKWVKAYGYSTCRPNRGFHMSGLTAWTN